MRDHCHITGEYRGAAHSHCNFQMKKMVKIPVFFHNFRGYDSDLVVQAFDQFKERNISVLGQGMEKYITLNWGDHLVFKHSLQFLSCSLEGLTANLLKSGRDQFTYLLDEFPGEEVDLLLRKGVYSYEYMDSAERFKETRLPSKQSFYSVLRQEAISDEDYRHAQHEWTRFGCETLQDYHDLYLKSKL